MVYRHRMKNGRIKHYQSKAHYERSIKGLFSNKPKPKRMTYKKQKITKKSSPDLSQRKKLSGKKNIYAPIQQRAQHKPHENKFLMEIPWKKAKKEFLYVYVDGELKKFGGKNEYSVDGIYIADALTAKNIQSIHNHPDPHPPSDRDIFDLLYSGNRTREVVMSSDGKMYVLLRTPKTKTLTKLNKEELIRSKKNGFTNEQLELMNKDEAKARKKFSKMYHDIAMRIASGKNLRSQQELKEKLPEIQKAMLDAMSEEYNFKYVKMLHSPKGKIQHNFLFTRMLFSKADAKKILHHVRFGYKGEMLGKR